jgi:hypothetical protein
VDHAINMGKWTPEEDAKLTEPVTQLGNNNWTRVAAMVPGRMDKQCSRRFGECLDPGTNKGNWTPEEGRMLTEAVTEFGNKNWFTVAAMVPGRRLTSTVSSKMARKCGPHSRTYVA